MPTHWRGVAYSWLGLLLLSPAAIAQPVSSEWQPVDALRPGTSITITLKGGERIEAPLLATTRTGLRVTLKGKEATVAKSDVQTVTRRVRDRLRNGVLIGTAVGFGVGFFGHAAYNAQATASGPIWGSEGIGYYSGTGLLGAGIGAAIGALVDAARQETEVLYSTRPR